VDEEVKEGEREGQGGEGERRGGGPMVGRWEEEKGGRPRRWAGHSSECPSHIYSEKPSFILLESLSFISEGGGGREVEEEVKGSSSMIVGSLPLPVLRYRTRAQKS